MTLKLSGKQRSRVSKLPSQRKTFKRRARELEPAQLSDDDPNTNMSEDPRAGQRERKADAAHAVPSVKEILDGVAAEAGLGTFDDDTFRSGLKHTLGYSYSATIRMVCVRICTPGMPFIVLTLESGTRALRCCARSILRLVRCSLLVRVCSYPLCVPAPPASDCHPRAVGAWLLRLHTVMTPNNQTIMKWGGSGFTSITPVSLLD